MFKYTIFHLFKFQEEETLDESLDKGYKSIVRTTDLKYVTDSADVTHNNQILKCSAKLPEMNEVHDQALVEVRCEYLLNEVTY